MRFMKGCMFQTRLVNNNGAATMRCIFGFIMSNNRLKKKQKPNMNKPEASTMEEGERKTECLCNEGDASVLFC